MIQDMTWRYGIIFVTIRRFVESVRMPSLKFSDIS